MTFKPMFIAGCVRSGTSLTAEVLNRHGVFIGNARSTRHPGTNTMLGTERIEFKPIIRELMVLNNYHKRREAPLPSNVKTIPGLREKVLALYPQDKPWLVKASSLVWFYDIFHEAFPDALWVLPWREPGDIVSSILRHPAMGRSTPDREKLFDYILAMQRKQSSIKVENINAASLNTEELVKKRRAQCLKPFLEKNGIKFSQKIIDETVNPEMWHSADAA
jgi:hypothetical protein